MERPGAVQDDVRESAKTRRTSRRTDMANFSDKELALSRIYAEALLDLAKGDGSAASLAEELRDLVAFVAANPDFARFLYSPTVDEDVRQQSLEKTLRGRASDLLVNTMQVLNRRGRLSLLPALEHSFRLVLEESQQRAFAMVRSASPLTDEQRRRLRETLRQKLNKEVDLVEHLEPDLLGGLVVQVGDSKFDMSAATQLRRIAARLAERASHEIHSGRAYVQ